MKLFFVFLLSVCVVPYVSAQADTIKVTLHSHELGVGIPSDYCGLSYESRMLLPDATGRYYFSKDNQKLVRMFRTLGVKSLRLGGNSVDVETTTPPSNEDLIHCSALPVRQA